MKKQGFIKSYRMGVAIFGGVLVTAGFILDYLVPKQGSQITTDWYKGSVPTMSIVGFALILLPYLGPFIINAIANRFSKKPVEPPPP